jgi:hypothetical protein
VLRLLGRLAPWLRDVGAAFAHIGGGALVTVSANKGGLDSWCRRAQALVSFTGADLAVSRELLGVKLDGQACIAERLGGYRDGAIGVQRDGASVGCF